MNLLFGNASSYFLIDLGNRAELRSRRRGTRLNRASKTMTSQRLEESHQTWKIQVRFPSRMGRFATVSYRRCIPTFFASGTSDVARYVKSAACEEVRLNKGVCPGWVRDSVGHPESRCPRSGSRVRAGNPRRVGHPQCDILYFSAKTSCVARAKDVSNPRIFHRHPFFHRLSVHRHQMCHYHYYYHRPRQRLHLRRNIPMLSRVCYPIVHCFDGSSN